MNASVLDCSSRWPLLALVKVSLRLLKERPDIVVYSLWRSRCFYLLNRLVLPGMQHVLFFHSASSAHVLDALSTRICLKIAGVIFVDSEATKGYIKKHYGFSGKVWVVPPIVQASQVAASKQPKKMIYLGRVNKRKGFDNVIRFMRHVERIDNAFSLDVYGPVKMPANMEKLIVESGIGSKIRFCGSIPPEQTAEIVSKYQYMVLLSPNEGMALAVLEGMGQGTVPLVYPAGEIASYCTDAYNSLTADGLDETSLLQLARKLIGLDSCYDEWRIVSNNAVYSTKEVQGMDKSLLKAISELSY
ncbi:MAG: hypothetical protein CMF25_05165 [Kangiellaceae bacterium]|nr:hypothetical protein [Kangiellaceae bacterium]